MSAVDDKTENINKNSKDDGWGDLDDIDYGDDEDNNPDIDDDDDMDGIGDLDLSDDDDDNDDNLPDTDAMSPDKQIKYEISSTLNNPNKIGMSFKLEFDAKNTPGNISDDDETAPNLRINHFQLITSSQSDDNETVLGSGTFAKVLRAKNTKNGKIVALKCMYKNLLRKQFIMKSRYNANDEEDAAPQMTRSTMLDAVQSELEIMLKLKHINIVRLYYIIDDPTKDQLYLSIEYSAYGQVMDFDGKLLQYVPNQKLLSSDEHIIRDYNVAQPWWYKQYIAKDDEEKRDSLRQKVERFEEKTAKKLFMDCVKGIEYLHNLNIIHRDIKPENLLLFGDNDHACGLMLKIADFGTAEEFESREEAILIDTMGTYHFMSPSAIGGDKRNGFFDDIWALGIVLYSFMFGTVPFFHPLDYQLFECIQNDELQLPDNEVLRASEEVRDLIAKILTKKDEDRITLDEIGKHAWYNGYVHPEYVIEDSMDLDLTEMENETCCVIL